MAVSTTSVDFSVTRREPDLVAPAKPTPRELKPLSDLDDQEGLRFHVPTIMFYENSPSAIGDPAKVIREALAAALVFYYPLAGRLVEGPNRKLMVDCTSEGVLFIEADADVTLDELGDDIMPPCTNLEDLLYNVPGSDGIVGCPLLLFQVTRLRCGGFILAVRLNHTMSDGFGLTQFLSAIGEMARGTPAPSTLPVWHRHLFNARHPPRITCTHHEYINPPTVIEPKTMLPMNTEVQKSFFFGPNELASLRRQLPAHLQASSTFEIVTACLCRCRTAALQLHPREEVRISCIVSVRGKGMMRLPSGFYGNTFGWPAQVSKAQLLCRNPLGYAIELVRMAKAQMSEEYIKSVADLTVIRGRPMFIDTWNFVVSDNTATGFDKVDFGWGKPILGGPATAVSIISFYSRFKNKKGEDGIVVPISLPQPVMKRFTEEIRKMTQNQPFEGSCNVLPTIVSTL
ncbi:methanol O-anthraniloyltransferase-like [Malania oleifera]|uniref:methanol O-anthraniloyltransferase-like n=1 Tax=Malania oleifera TaxID=397392 RepID=UPI0025ADF606|nr:methanol O-anthraniloyltransferase-like [Malania oleifera]